MLGKNKKEKGKKQSMKWNKTETKLENRNYTDSKVSNVTSKFERQKSI